MNSFFGFLLHAIFFTTFSFILIVTIILLKPFRIHPKRPVSTIIYKFSYLLYLLVFLIMAYKALFYIAIPGNFENISFDKNDLLYYIIISLAFFLPHVAIMIRKKIIKERVIYNYIFTFTVVR